MTGDPQALNPARLPWNTTRTMADVWADEDAVRMARLWDRRARRLALSMAPPPSVSNSGKVPFAGYDVTDHWNER